MKYGSTRLNIQEQRGLAIVEFAIAVPVLLLMMLGMAELGRCLYQYNALNKQVRNAARYVASNARVGSTSVVNITNAIPIARNLVVFGNEAGTGSALLPNLAVGNVTVSNNSATPDYVLVQVDYTYQPIIGNTLETFGMGDNLSLLVPLKASVVMRVL